MAKIVYVIQDNQVAGLIAKFVAAVPNSEKNEDGSQKYTDSQWIKEWGRRQFIQQIMNGEKKLYSIQFNQTVNEGDIA